MKKHIISLLVLLLMLPLLTIPVSADTLEASHTPETMNESTYSLTFAIDGTFDYAKAQEVFAIVNEERAAEGLGALTLDPVLTAMAMNRAAECAVYYSHTRPDGSEWSGIIQENSSYAIGSYAENIAAGYTSASAVMGGWMNSSGHYANIMNADYTSAGIGCFYQDGAMYWVQLFHSKTVNTAAVPSDAQYQSAIPITVSSDYLELHYAGYDDCNVPLYQGVTSQPKIYVTNTTHNSERVYLSGGYRLESTDTTLATASGKTITGVAPGVLTIRLHFGTGYFSIPYEIHARPTLSHTFDTSGNPVITWDNTSSARLYYREANDDLWTVVSVNVITNTFTHYNTFPGEVFTYVVRFYDDVYGWIEVSDRLVVKIPGAGPVITATNTEDGIRLTWEAIEDAQYYEIYRSGGTGTAFELIDTTTSAGYLDESLTPGQTCSYYAVAVFADGSRSRYNSIVSVTGKLESPVVKAANVASSGKVKLTWTAVDGASSYRVYRAASKTGTYSLLKTTTACSFTNTGAKAGVTHYYYVVACGSNSDAASEASNIVTRTCDCARPVVSISNVASSGKIKLKWDAVDGAVKYRVYRSTSKNGEYKLMKTTTGTSYTNTSAKAGTLYYYKVVAVAEKSAANSVYSSYKSRTCDLPRPDVSITLKNGKPRLTWDAIDGAVSYKIYRATSKTGTYSLLKTTTGTSFTNTGAKSGTTYYYKVVAVHSRSAANSAYSLVDSIKAK